MKTLPKMEISEELDARINEGIKMSSYVKRCRPASSPARPAQFAARFQPPHCGWKNEFAKLWLNPLRHVQWGNLRNRMKAIVDGR